VIDDPKVAALGMGAGTAAGAVGVLVAQVTWPEVGLEFVKTLGTVAGAIIALFGTIYAAKANSRAKSVERKTEAQNVELKDIKRQTNGVVDAERIAHDRTKAELAETQRKLEAALLVVPPNAAAPVIEVLKTSGS
jgi:hypothetical protein